MLKPPDHSQKPLYDQHHFKSTATSQWQMRRKVPWRRSTGLEVTSLASFKTFPSGKTQTQLHPKINWNKPFQPQLSDNCSSFHFLSTLPRLWTPSSQDSKTHFWSHQTTFWPWFFSSDIPNHILALVIFFEYTKAIMQLLASLALHFQPTTFASKVHYKTLYRYGRRFWNFKLQGISSDLHAMSLYLQNSNNSFPGTTKSGSTRVEAPPGIASGR